MVMIVVQIVIVVRATEQEGARYRDKRSQRDAEINQCLGRAEQTLQHGLLGMRVPYRSGLRFYNFSARLEWLDYPYNANRRIGGETPARLIEVPRK